MKRLIVAGALGAVASLLATTPASAAPPEPVTDSVVLSACGFPVRLDVSGKLKMIEHGDQLITVAPTAKATLTNIGTGESIRINIAGAFHEHVLPNGDLVGKGTGHNFFIGPEIEGILYTTGKVLYTQDAQTGVVTITAPSANSVNLCDVLA